jgi:AcrR family transcriptional regulator
MGDDTRSRLVESALTLLREGGLEAVTLRAVGDASGLSRSAAYRHFTDKTALLAIVSARVLTDLCAAVTEAVLRHDDQRDRLRAFYASYAAYAQEHREEYRLVFASVFLAGDHPELQGVIDEVVDALGMEVSGDSPVSKARLMALLCTAHGLAELTIADHLAHKGLRYSDVVDALVP